MLIFKGWFSLKYRNKAAVFWDSLDAQVKTCSGLKPNQQDLRHEAHLFIVPICNYRRTAGAIPGIKAALLRKNLFIFQTLLMTKEKSLSLLQIIHTFFCSDIKITCLLMLKYILILIKLKDFQNHHELQLLAYFIKSMLSRALRVLFTPSRMIMKISSEEMNITECSLSTKSLE